MKGFLKRLFKTSETEVELVNRAVHLQEMINAVDTKVWSVGSDVARLNGLYYKLPPVIYSFLEEDDRGYEIVHKSAEMVASLIREAEEESFILDFHDQRRTHANIFYTFVMDTMSIPERLCMSKRILR